jgi:hypothetical protein
MQNNFYGFYLNTDSLLLLLLLSLLLLYLRDHRDLFCSGRVTCTHIFKHGDRARIVTTHVHRYLITR